jgi:hypothetical protein
MTREEEIREASLETKIPDLSKQVIYGLGFIDGAKFADSHPNKKLVYTKKELLDMGFGFDLNGNIVTPQEIEERSKKYIKYRKDKWVEKTYEWLEHIAECTGHDS